MKKLKSNPFNEQKEWTIYALFYFFIISFLFKTVFGFMTDSKTLLVSGIFSLFGILIAIVTLMRLRPVKSSKSFNQGKLEPVIILWISAMIAVSTTVIAFAVCHMLFFHTLFPPQISASWIAAIAAAGSLGFMEWFSTQIGIVPEGEEDDIVFILQTDFIFSILAVVAVVVSRMGAYILDYACAIFASTFIIIYSARFLYTAFKGLMDVSCDRQTISIIEKTILHSEPGYVLQSLRVNKVGHIIEIMAFFSVPLEARVSEISDRLRRTKEAVRIKFTKPHEMFVGIVPLIKP